MALEMENPESGLFDREEAGILNKKILEAKKLAEGLFRLFKEREALFELKKIHKQRVYEEMRSEFEVKF